MNYHKEIKFNTEQYVGYVHFRLSTVVSQGDGSQFAHITEYSVESSEDIDAEAIVQQEISQAYNIPTSHIEIAEGANIWE